MPAKERLRVAVLASGRGSNLQALIDASTAGRIDADVTQVISDRRDSEALNRARHHRIPDLFIDPGQFPSREAYDDRIVESLEAAQIGLVILAGYMRVVTSRLINAYRMRIINIHPSLLPAFPGLHAQRKTLESGARVSGCTVHFVEEEVDSGPIIIQAAVPVLGMDNEKSLAARILEQEHRILPHAVQWFAEGRLKVEGRLVRVQGESSDDAGAILSPQPPIRP
jgi:phosphoribosylglycinamide formyltransferase 1